MPKRSPVDRAIQKYGIVKLATFFRNKDGGPLSYQSLYKWRWRFPPGRAIEWEEKIGDPRYVTAPEIYPPSEYKKR